MKPNPASNPPTTNAYGETIAGRGLRMTEQRRAVYDSLMAQADHPTAVEVFMRVKGRMPNISLATVYNCLQNLVETGLIRHVHHDRESSRYCGNLADHAHLFCDGCGSVTDLPARSDAPARAEQQWEIPARAVVSRHDASFRGLCPSCATADPAVPPGAERPKKSKS